MDSEPPQAKAREGRNPSRTSLSARRDLCKRQQVPIARKELKQPVSARRTRGLARSISKHFCQGPKDKISIFLLCPGHELKRWRQEFDCIVHDSLSWHILVELNCPHPDYLNWTQLLSSRVLWVPVKLLASHRPLSLMSAPSVPAISPPGRPWLTRIVIVESARAQNNSSFTKTQLDFFYMSASSRRKSRKL